MNRIASSFIAVCLASPLFGQTVSDVALDVTRVLPESARPNDWRLGELKDLNGYFPMEVPASKEAWLVRAEKIRRRILVSCGLWPMPARPAVEPTIHGKVERDEYTVERVYFESYPGFYVTGSLYRPKGKQGPFPVVLSPHGHFANGRFHDHGEEEAIRQFKMGAEFDRVGGRHPIQARCVQLARMGCVVFQYDMLGYADNKQIGFEIAHRHSEQRPELENAESWGLFTVQAEMRLQNVFGLQTFNSLRAVDFVVGLPDVDASRIGVTGASGGGTQTMILAALEPRVTVSFPAVMVSTAMQGGCTCENATCLRVGTGNIEFAALFAPKPQGITRADDWTVEVKEKGFPELQSLYELFGQKQNIAVFPEHDLFWPHNFNHVCRNAMYEWMNAHFGLGLKIQEILEESYTPLSIEEMTVWNDEHPEPPSGVEFERRFLQELSDTSDRQMQELAAVPKDFRRVVKSALTTILAASFDDIGAVARNNVEKVDAGEYLLFRDRINADETELPIIFLHPKNWNHEVVIWVSGKGKASLVNDAGELRDEVTSLLNRGYSVVGIDLFQQGEFLGRDSFEQTRKVKNDRDFAGYTFGYNSTVVGHRVRDLMTLLKFVDNDDHGTKRVHMLGIEGASHLAVLTNALAGQHIDRLAIDDGDFRFSTIDSWRDPDFLPGAIKYGDLPAFVSLGKSDRLWIATREKDHAESAVKPFAGADWKPTFHETNEPVRTAVAWMLE